MISLTVLLHWSNPKVWDKQWQSRRRCLDKFALGRSRRKSERLPEGPHVGKFARPCLGLFHCQSDFSRLKTPERLKTFPRDSLSFKGSDFPKVTAWRNYLAVQHFCCWSSLGSILQDAHGSDLIQRNPILPQETRPFTSQSTLDSIKHQDPGPGILVKTVESPQGLSGKICPREIPRVIRKLAYPRDLSWANFPDKP